MAEAIKSSEHYYTKEFNSYNNSEDNFVANQEITVTITLQEYRKLVKAEATSQQKIDAANNEKYKMLQERDVYKEENSKLKSKIYELQNSEEEVNE